MYTPQVMSTVTFSLFNKHTQAHKQRDDLPLQLTGTLTFDLHVLE